MDSGVSFIPLELEYVVFQFFIFSCFVLLIFSFLVLQGFHLFTLVNHWFVSNNFGFCFIYERKIKDYQFYYFNPVIRCNINMLPKNLKERERSKSPVRSNESFRNFILFSFLTSKNSQILISVSLKSYHIMISTNLAFWNWREFLLLRFMCLFLEPKESLIKPQSL